MKVFPIAPAGSGPFLVFVLIGALMLTLTVVFAFMAYSSRSLRFEVGASALKISGDLYGRTIPFSSLEIDRLQVMNLNEQREYRMRWRTNGVGLPNFASGWFKLRNGEKSLVFVTDRCRVVYIPTRDGYSLLVSPKQPDEFATALKSAAGY